MGNKGPELENPLYDNNVQLSKNASEDFTNLT